MTKTRPRLLIGIVVAAAACYLLVLLAERLYRAHADSLINPGYSRIEDKLYLGGRVDEPPPGTQATLNLCEFADPYQSEIHVWKPIRDAAPAPSIDWLRQQVAFIEAQQDASRITYVHCFQGASRSAMVVIAYMMHKHDWPRDQALAHVRAKRLEARPNPAFMELLSEWERERKVKS